MFKVLLTAAFVCLASIASAQSAPSHGWLDVNFVRVQSAQDTQTYTIRRTLFSEPATGTTNYPAMGHAKGVQLSGGVFAHAGLGFAVGFDNVNTDYVVGLGVTIPHPTVFGRSASATSVTTSTLTRKDRGVDLSVVYQPTTPDAWRIRVFGGPTYFSVTQGMVEVINYNQIFNSFTGLNLVSITTFTQKDVEGSAWGFHGGVDVAYFFSKYAGVGGVIRANHGTVSIDAEPLTGAAAELTAGHVTAGGGLRLRF